MFASHETTSSLSDLSYHRQLQEGGLFPRDLTTQTRTTNGESVNSIIRDGINPREKHKILPALFRDINDPNELGSEHPVKIILDAVVPMSHGGQEYKKRRLARQAADRGVVSDPKGYTDAQYQLGRFFDHIMYEFTQLLENIGGAKYAYKVRINGAVEEGTTNFHTKGTGAGQGALELKDIRKKVRYSIVFLRQLSDIHKSTFDHIALIYKILDGLL